MSYFKKICIWLGIITVVILGSIVLWPYLNWGNSKYWHDKGSRLQREKSYMEALGVYEHLTALDSTDHTAWNFKADILYRLRRFNEASESYDRVLAIDPDNHNASLLKAQALGFAGKPTEAIAVYDRLLSTGANNPVEVKETNKAPTFEILLLEGRTIQLIQLEQYQEALNTLDYAIGRAPYDINLWNARVVPLLALNQHEEIIENSEIILQMNPDSLNAAVAWNSKGTALFDLHRYDEALEAFNQAFQFNPKFGIIWYNWARLHMLKGHKDSAISCLKTALELDPTLKANISQDENLQSLMDSSLYQLPGLENIETFRTQRR